MANNDYEYSEFGISVFPIEIDAKMLSFRCKNHRGRSPSNRTGELCIVVVGQ
ncbi:hypothetical protein H311_01461 [Anncaliia algerae PRA109]|nr:hypothetical protein H311_01461 [Anncaliia algerae PRA109]